MAALIDLKDISYQRSADAHCARQLSFSLLPGQKVAITGSNGSGKSTLLQIMMGLLPNVNGEVRLFGEYCKSERQFACYRTQLGLVFQDPDDQLFCPTVLEDVCFGPVNQGIKQQDAERKALQTLADLGIEHLAQRVSYQLSGGQKRLVALASVLVMQPKVLLLDEPTNGLDDANYQRLIEILGRLDLPLILVSHDANLRKILTEIEYRLEDGTLTHVDTVHNAATVNQGVVAK
jgi:cobalt/nickel transport system ATP-binding protein